RANKMARLVFNKANMEQIKEGLDLLLDLFIDTMAVPFEHGNCFSHEDVMARFEQVEQKKWRPIRNMFLLDPFYGYVNGEFNAEENASPAKILLDFISVFNQIHNDCMARLEEYQKIIAAISKEKREAEGALAKLEMKESEHRMATSQEKTDIKAARSTIEYLEKMVKEKNEKIAEMEKLEKQNAELKKSQEALQKKYNMIEELHKRQKMKTELAREMPPLASKPEEELKRQLYLLEKDLVAMERELLGQQRLFSTLLCGIKTDLYIVGESLTDPDTGQNPFKDFVRVSELIDQLSTAMAQGELDEARAKLPPHYTYLPSDFKMRRIKRVSNLSQAKLPPLQGVYAQHAEGDGDKQSNDGTNGDHAGVKTQVPPIQENPQLVDPETNVVNFVTCMKHFPHLSVDFIKEHWSKFKEFDTNGDQAMDFTEVVRALTAMGVNFTAPQAEEAMREADVNGSRTLDFYEYVIVADKLVHRTGRSELFHQGNQKDRKILSKTCLIQ
ncbi:hypothetical protein BaRGS_00029740, partial [Batillaria attramentaria]